MNIDILKDKEFEYVDYSTDVKYRITFDNMVNELLNYSLDNIHVNLYVYSYTSFIESNLSIVIYDKNDEIKIRYTSPTREMDGEYDYDHLIKEYLRNLKINNLIT